MKQHPSFLEGLQVSDYVFLNPTLEGALETFLHQCVIGLTNGALFALIALGYTLVYSIVELVNFAHGDLFMLGSTLALTLVGWLGLAVAGPVATAGGIVLLLVVVPLFCAALNLGVERVIYRPLRQAPRLAPLVSAIGVSFVFMNVGLWWIGAADIHFPDLVPSQSLFEIGAVQFTTKDMLMVGITVSLLVCLTVFVKYTSLGRAMRATAQDPLAARLMGINVDRIIALAFGIGGFLAGVASVIYCLYINTVGFQMGFRNGLYAFTAAVLGGIGNVPGAVIGALLIGLIRALGSAYLGEQWANPLIFGVLLGVLVFRPAGLLGVRTREKV